MEILGIVIASAVLSVMSGYLIRSQTQKESRISEETPTDPEDWPKPVPAGRRNEAIYLILAWAADLSAGLFMRFYYENTVLDILNVLVILAVLWACARIDRESFTIPNQALLIGLGLRCILLLFEMLKYPERALYLLISSGAAAIALLLITVLCRLASANAIGFGDVKLLMLMGFVLQNDRVWGAVLASMVIAFFYALYLVIFKKATGKTEMPFAPLLLAGTWLSVIIFTV